MAQRGRATIPRLQFRGRSKVPSTKMSSMFRGGGTEQPTEKERFSYLKDAYVFAKNNKDLLENPEVQATLLGMIDKAGFAPITEQKPTAGIYGTTPEGTPYAHAPVGRGEQKVDYPATIKSLYERFATEHAELFRPYEKETMRWGKPVTERVQPLAPEGMRSEIFSQQPKGYAPGTYFPSRFEGGVPTGKGFQVPYPEGSTAAGGKAAKPRWKQAWNVTDPTQSTMFDVNEHPTPPEGYTYTPPAQTRGERREDMNVLWDVEQQINEILNPKPGTRRREVTQEMVDMWNRQLEAAELDYEVVMQFKKKSTWGMDWLAKDREEPVLVPKKRKTTEQPTRQPTAVNPKTGERLIWNGKAWVPET